MPLLLLLLCFSCQNDDDAASPTENNDAGAIFVTVRSFSGNPVANATVTTMPETSTGMTNSNGTFLINDVPRGIYQVCVVKSDVGAATGVASVVSGIADEVELVLDPAAIRGPMVNIFMPGQNTLVDVDQDLDLLGFASDLIDVPQDLLARWSSNLDGVLVEDVSPNTEGRISTTVSGLTIGEHMLKLEVEDSDGNVGADSVRIEVLNLPDQVSITQLSTSNEGVRIDWEPSEAENFFQYLLQRSQGDGSFPFYTTIATISEREISTYLDQNAVLFNQYTYRIVLLTQDGMPVNGDSRSVVYDTDLPEPLSILSLEQVSNGIEISWEMSNNPDFFANYEIQRQTQFGGFQLVGSVSDVNQLSFVDTNVDIFETYTYRIAHVIGGAAATELGPAQSIEFTVDFISIDGRIERMLADPDRPFIYAVDRVNNNLYFINTDEETVSKTIFVGSAPVDLDLHPNGDLLYIANFGSSEITVVDLNSQEISFTFFVETDLGTWDGNPYRISLLDANRLAFTSEDQWNNIKIVNANTGTSIAVTNNSVYEPGLLIAPNGALYVSESGSSGSSILRYNSQFQVVDESVSETNYRNRDALITADGQHIFYNEKKILASNLQSVLGEFPEQIYAINSTGTIAVGDERFFDGITFAISGFLPVDTDVMVFGTDDQTIYLYDDDSSRLIPWELVQ